MSITVAAGCGASTHPAAAAHPASAPTRAPVTATVTRRPPAAHPSGPAHPAKRAHLTSPVHRAAVKASLRGEIALHFALAQRGKPYVYGGTGPWSYDCSGLVQRAWRAAGVAIPRTTEQQARTGSPVPLSRIRLGDLVIFYRDASHVGIYAGDGRVVVAPHRGATVTVEEMKWMPVYTVRRPG